MWPRSLVGRRPTDICEARARIPSKCESYQAFFSAIAFTAAFLQISDNSDLLSLLSEQF